MKNIQTFEEFLNESLDEAMQISDNLKSVKNADDLKKAVGSDFLIIHSKHRIGDESKRGGDYPQMWMIRGLNSTIKVDGVGYLSSLYDLNKFDDPNYTGMSTKWTMDDIFTFYEFNKKRGNLIYTIDEIPIHKESKKIIEKWRDNNKKIDSLLGNTVDSPGNRSVMTSSYAVKGEGDSHGVRYLEFDAPAGNGKTFTWNAYSFDPSIREGRGIVKFGWGRGQQLYRIDKKTGLQILKLAEEQVDLMKQAGSLIRNYYKQEKIQPK